MWKMGPQGSSSCFNKYLNIFKQSRTLTGKKTTKELKTKYQGILTESDKSCGGEYESQAFDRRNDMTKDEDSLIW